MSSVNGDDDKAESKQYPIVDEREVQENEHHQSDEGSSRKQKEEDIENTKKYEQNSERCESSTTSTQVSNEHNWPQVTQEPVPQGKLNRELEREKECSDISSEKNKDFGDTCSDSEKSLIVSKHLVSVWIKTVGIFLFAFAMGAFLSGLGVCLVHVSILLNIDNSEFIIIFVGQGIGFLIGSAGSILLVNRLPVEPQFAVMMFISFITTTVSPWINNVYGFSAMRLLAAMGAGYCDSGSNTYLFFIWADSRYKALAQFGKMLFFGLGSLIIPLGVVNFLAKLNDLPSTQSVHCTFVNQTDVNGTLTSLTATNCTNVTVAGLPPDVSSVNYAFVLMGLLFVPGFLCMIAVSLPALATSMAPKNKFYSLEPAPATETSASGCLVHTFILLMAAIALMYTYTVGTLIQYLQSFVTLGLNWDVRNAAYLNTVMGLGNVIGRVIGMPLSIHVPVFSIVAGSVLTLTLGCILIVLVGLGSVPQGVMWAGTIIAGIGWSPVVSCAFYWTNQVTGLTVTQSAVITFSINVGEIFGPTLTSYLFAMYGFMSMAWVALSGSIAQCVIAALLYIVGRQLARHSNGEVTALRYNVVTV